MGPSWGLKLQNPEAPIQQLQILAMLAVRNMRIGTEGEVKAQKGILVLRDFFFF